MKKKRTKLKKLYVFATKKIWFMAIVGNNIDITDSI